MIPNLLLLVQNTGITRRPAEEFGHLDPYGLGMTLMAMTVVFSGLVMLYLTFKYISKLYSIDWKKRKKRTPEIQAPAEEQSGEVNAAIALALHLYKNQLHDNENAIITIKKVGKMYSPWSSKIYGLRNTPR